jgi:hypothetical protein
LAGRNSDREGKGRGGHRGVRQGKWSAGTKKEEKKQKTPLGGGAFITALCLYCPQVLNVVVSCTGWAGRPAVLVYCLTTPVWVSVTVAVKSTSVVAAKNTQ